MTNKLAYYQDEATKEKITIYNYKGEKIEHFPSVYMINQGNPLRWLEWDTGKEFEYYKGSLNSILIEEVE